MQRMSLDDEAVENHEAIVRHWLVISADGVITPVEKTQHDQLQRDQSWTLLFRATWKRWARRLANRGADARTIRDMQRTHVELEGLRPRYRVTTVPFGVDPFGTMAAE